MTHSFGAGVFPDVTIDADGRGALIFREGDPRSPGYVRVYSWLTVTESEFVGLHEAAKYPVGAGSPAFPRIYLHEGLLWAAYHDGTKGHLHCLTNGAHEVLEPCENNDPIVFGAGYVAWQGAAALRWPVSLMDLGTGQVMPTAADGRGTGLAYLATDRVVTVDENRMSVPGMVNPVRSGALIVGEDPDPNNRDNLSAVWTLGSETGRLWPSQPCLTPRCAAADKWLAIATWGQGASVRLFVGDRAALLAASSAPVPIPVPVPVPQPIPEPSTMQLPDAVQSTIRAMWPKVKHLHAGSDEQRREGTKAMIEQVVFSHPGQGYGWKSGDVNRPPSKDAMAQQVDGKLYYIDLINGSTRELADLTGPLEDITGQHFIDVAGVNHLGVSPQPQPNPTPVPQPVPQPGDVTMGMLLAEIKRLQNHLGVR